MQTWIRVTVTTALALTGLEGQAKVADRCIHTLEARPDAAPRPCPLAIGYAPRQPVSAARPPTRNPVDAQSSRRVVTAAADARDAVRTDDKASALHV